MSPQWQIAVRARAGGAGRAAREVRRSARCRRRLPAEQVLHRQLSGVEELDAAPAPAEPTIAERGFPLHRCGAGCCGAVG